MLMNFFIPNCGPNVLRGNIQATTWSYSEPRKPEDPDDPDFESSDDEVDYVLLHYSSIDSDVPLSEYADWVHAHKQGSTPEFMCRNKENFPRKHSFMAKPGLRVTLRASDSAHKFLKFFFHVRNDNHHRGRN